MHCARTLRAYIAHGHWARTLRVRTLRATRVPLPIGGLAMPTTLAPRHQSYLFKCCRIFQRAQITRIPAFGERLNTSTQQLSGAGLRQHGNKMNSSRTRDCAELRVNCCHYFLLLRRPGIVRCDLTRIFRHRKSQRHLSFQLINDTYNRHFRNIRM